MQMAQLSRELKARHVESARAGIQTSSMKSRSDFILQYLPDEVVVDDRSFSLISAMARVRAKCLALIELLQRY